MRTGTGFEKSGVPTMTATGSSPNWSRNTTKRVRTPEFERNVGVARDRAATRWPGAEARHGARLDGDDRRIELGGALRRGVGDQHGGQHLRELDQFDRRARGGTRRLRQQVVMGVGVGDQRDGSFARRYRA